MWFCFLGFANAAMTLKRLKMALRLNIRADRLAARWRGLAMRLFQARCRPFRAFVLVRRWRGLVRRLWVATCCRRFQRRQSLLRLVVRLQRPPPSIGEAARRAGDWRW